MKEKQKCELCGLNTQNYYKLRGKRKSEPRYMCERCYMDNYRRDQRNMFQVVPVDLAICDYREQK